MLVVEFKDEDGKFVGTLTANSYEFKTGSTGFRAFGKMVLDEEKYQVNVNVVLIGSKPKDEPKDKSSK